MAEYNNGKNWLVVGYLDNMNGVESLPPWKSSPDGHPPVKSVYELAAAEAKNEPRRFRLKIEEGKKHPNSTEQKYRYGVYFPVTDWVVDDMGDCGTGIPKDVEWLDPKPEH